LTKPGLAVWSATPDGRPPLLSDLAAEAAAATGSVEVVDEYHGPGRVVSATVSYAGMEPARTFVVADVGPDRRTVACSDEGAVARAVTAGELIGTDVRIEGTRLEC
jgi:hypothetical protein